MDDVNFEFGVPVNWYDAKTSREKIELTNNNKQMRAAAEKEPELIDAVLDSMLP